MKRQVKANFKVTKWDQVAMADVGAGYLAQERFVGRLGERTGTFDTGARRLEHGGTALANGQTPFHFGYVVPNSGMGELKGLTGTVLYRHDEARAVVVLDYEFEGDGGPTGYGRLLNY